MEIPSKMTEFGYPSSIFPLTHAVQKPGVRDSTSGKIEYHHIL